MPYTVGSQVFLTASFTDGNNAAFDPSAVTVTITLPDGTNSGALSATKVATGSYSYTYTTTETGIHQFYFAGTGPASIQPSDIFTVIGTATAGLISIQDAKTILNKSGASHVDDLELRGWILSATEIINTQCGYTVPTTFAETTSSVIDSGGRQVLMLSKTPVLSVQSIAPTQLNIPQIDISTLVINGDQGIIYLANWWSWWGPQLVNYTAGRTTVSPSLQQAAALIVQYFWESQRGGGVSNTVAGFGGDETQEFNGMPGFPTRALDLMRMAPYYAAPGLA